MKPNKTPRKHAAFASSSRQMKRRPKVKSLLAVLVAFCTVCALTMPAATLEGQAQASCGLAEHTHDESCYESVLVCGQEESEGHVHDESCYEEALTCEIPEHTHSEACWAQPETQAEAGNEENSEAVTGDGVGSDMEAAAGTETGTETEADTGTGTGTDSSENGDAAEAGSETDSSGNAGTGAGDNGSAESGAESGDGQTGNGGAGSEADGTAENGSGTENAGEQGESTSDEDALTEEEKTEEAENPQAAEEAAEMPDGATVPEGYTEQYTVRDEGNGFAVTVYAPEGVVPEGAVLSAELLSEETEEYAAAEQELAAETEAVMAENGVSALSKDGAVAASEDGEAAAPSYGFAALDIHFEDENGEEVEPNGDVYVVIDAAGLLPEDADPESVTVQHHAEQEDGSVTVETVADTAEETAGVVAVVENEAQAENDVQAAFEVDGFSRFTITWDNGRYYGRDEYFEVTAYYVDVETGQEINIGNAGLPDNVRITFPELPDQPQNADKNQEYPVSAFETQSFEEYKISIENYKECSGIYYGEPNGEEITSVTATVSGTRYFHDSDWGSWFDEWRIKDEKRILTFKNAAGEPVATLTAGTDSKADIYFAYEKEEDIDVPVIPSRTLTNEKYVEYNAYDDTYDLTLTVSGAVSSTQGENPVDVIFVLDRSASMHRSIYNNNDDDNNNRMTYAKQAIQTMTNSLSNTDGIDARYALVTFHTHAETETFAGSTWTSNVNTFNSEVDTQSYVTNGNSYNKLGGTNYEAALDEVIALQNEAREGARLVVVFVSDGDPTFYYDNNGNTPGDGRSFSEKALEEGQICMSQLNRVNTFYTVGVGPESSYAHLSDLTDESDFPYYWESGGRHQYQLPEGMEQPKNYIGNSPENLQNAFDDMAAQITSILCDHVSVIDNLSENVDIVMNGNVPEKLQVTIIDNDTNEIIAGPDANITAPVTETNPASINRQIKATYDEANDQLKLEFAPEYKLEPGWTYQITTTIKATETAYENYRENNNSYPDKGESDTGVTSAGEDGVYTNKSAKVYYTFNDEELNKDYPMPVIQLHPKTLTLTKEIEGVELSDEELATYLDALKFDVKIGTNTSEELRLSDFTYNEESGLYELSIAGLSPNTLYEISEKNGSIPGYDWTQTDTNNTEGALPAWNGEDEVTVGFTNQYSRQAIDINVRKEDSLTKEGLSGAEFLLYKKEGTGDIFYSYDKDTDTVSWVNKADMTDDSKLVSGTDGAFIIQNLPDGTYYLVESKAPNGYLMLTEPVVINIHNGSITVSGSGSRYDADKKVIIVSNNAGTELPETGGPGTTILTIGGLLLMAGAVGGGYGLRRRRGKEGR